VIAYLWETLFKETRMSTYRDRENWNDKIAENVERATFDYKLEFDAKFTKLSPSATRWKPDRQESYSYSDSNGSIAAGGRL